MTGNRFLEKRLAEAEKAKQLRVKCRQKLWADIQEHAPELAGFMVGLNKAFGRVELEGVWMAGLWQDEYLSKVIDCELRIEELNDWEQSFMQSLRVCFYRPRFQITPRQIEKLESIWERVTADQEAVTSVNGDVFGGGNG